MERKNLSSVESADGLIVLTALIAFVVIAFVVVVVIVIETAAAAAAVSVVVAVVAFQMPVNANAPNCFGTNQLLCLRSK